jgi:membrane associated rhomboid family serine protease
MDTWGAAASEDREDAGAAAAAAAFGGPLCVNPRSWVHRLHARVILGVLGAVFISYWYWSRQWRGVLVAGGGEERLNGYYYFVGTKPPQMFYTRSETELGIIPPDFYSLSTLAPTLHPNADERCSLWTDPEGTWAIGKGSSARALSYYSQHGIGGVVPPSHGWSVAKGTKAPPPAVSCTGVKPNPPRPTFGRQSNSGPAAGLSDALAKPATTLILVVIMIVAYRLWAGRVSVDRVSVSYESVVVEKQYWRAVTASFSHFEMMHLFFNCMSLYNMGGLEVVLGTVPYLYLSADLVTLTMILIMVIKWVMVRFFRASEGSQRQGAVGYSCVLFAFMTMASVRQNQFCPLPMMPTFCFDTHYILSLPVNIGPWAVLFGAQLLMPRAGFVGHLSGLLLGYPLAWGLLDWITPPMLTSLIAILLLQHSAYWPWQQHGHSQNGQQESPVRAQWRMQSLLHMATLLVILSIAGGVGPHFVPWTAWFSELLWLLIGWIAAAAAYGAGALVTGSDLEASVSCLLLTFAAGQGVLIISKAASIGAIWGKFDYLEAGLGAEQLRRAVKYYTVVGLLNMAAADAALRVCVNVKSSQTLLARLGLQGLIFHHSSLERSAQSVGRNGNAAGHEQEMVAGQRLGGRGASSSVGSIRGSAARAALARAEAMRAGHNSSGVANMILSSSNEDDEAQDGAARNDESSSLLPSSYNHV